MLFSVCEFGENRHGEGRDRITVVRVTWQYLFLKLLYSITSRGGTAQVAGSTPSGVIGHTIALELTQRLTEILGG